ncbi:hypothetical protein BN8_06218 [Fibrisoma limi BUZ 3]|uniref:DUF6265 domain-containing protein n=1 Tax=Fibrisoma limi BUZ 3 TaxID=1185876 RepID=I2GSF2_9BACT|nr:DUF6265 family protein [Fibrisoma limi]CCH56831.1 hypothetical protein BN8_06218 [Fibrisoma limi BUZ 3]
MKTLVSLFIFYYVLAIAASGQSQPKTGSLNDVNFLAGHWLGTYNGGPIEANWTAPAGDNIVGFIRMMKDDKVTLYELFAFEQTSSGPVAMVKHFKPGLIGVEEKDKSDRYKFIEAKKDQALFEKEDGSIRIIYEKRGPDQLVIRRGQPKDGNWAFNDLFVFYRAQ